MWMDTFLSYETQQAHIKMECGSNVCLWSKCASPISALRLLASVKKRMT